MQFTLSDKCQLLIKQTAKVYLIEQDDRFQLSPLPDIVVSVIVEKRKHKTHNGARNEGGMGGGGGYYIEIVGEGRQAPS